MNQGHAGLPLDAPVGKIVVPSKPQESITAEVKRKLEAFDGLLEACEDLLAFALPHLSEDDGITKKARTAIAKARNDLR